MTTTYDYLIIGSGIAGLYAAILARENPDKTVFCLDPVVCPCATMYRIHPAYLAWTLDELAAGRVVNRVDVPDEIAKHAKVALERMLSVK